MYYILLDLCQTLNTFSWANSLTIKSITRSVIFVSIGKNERCKIRLLLIFSIYPEAIFKVLKIKKFFVQYFENGLWIEAEISLINNFLHLIFTYTYNYDVSGCTFYYYVKLSFQVLIKLVLAVYSEKGKETKTNLL